MTKVRMRDTTAHADHGQLLAGEVYDLPDEVAEHLVKRAGLAKPAHADTETYHERMAAQREAQPAAAEEEEATTAAMQRRIDEAGTRPADQSTGGMPQRAPINPPIRRGGR